jgi:hypothetical protein
MDDGFGTLYNHGKYKDWKDWYDNGPGSEHFKRSLLKRRDKMEDAPNLLESAKKPQWQPKFKNGPVRDDDVPTDANKEKSLPYLHKGPMVTGVKKETECCKDIKPENLIHGPDEIALNGDDAFGSRLCGRCGAMSDKKHRDNCQSGIGSYERYNDDPGQDIWPRNKAVTVHVRKISNGYVISVNGEKQIFYANDTVIVTLFKRLLDELS